MRNINQGCTTAGKQWRVAGERPETKLEAPGEARENWISSLGLRKSQTGN